MVTIKLNEQQAELIHQLTRDHFLKMQDEVIACGLTTPPNVRRIMEAARDVARDLAAIVDASIDCEETQDGDAAPEATAQQFDAIRARAFNDVARGMMKEGVVLSHSQANELGEEALRWVRERLQLQPYVDHLGLRFSPALERTGPIRAR
jgi:hypothetical protein